jgi:hypothetical protein
MDVLIISTNTQQQALYWQQRLEATRGQIAKADALLACVYEDWRGGAGNGLGTLYAYQKAQELLLRTHGVDLFHLQQEGASIALYHTAGKGTRLAPLPGSEYNNKAAVKLPALIPIKRILTPVTILEAVIRQTACYAKSRAGRLSVFWGDQIFIPSVSTAYQPKHHIDVMTCLQDFPSQAEWEKRGLNRYGLLAIDGKNEAQLVEKVDYVDVAHLLQRGQLNIDGGFGTSLGHFSLSHSILSALLDEFSKELIAKQQALGSDYDFWMPLTLEWEAYRQVLSTDTRHYQRMQRFKTAFVHEHGELGLFGVVDVGRGSYWWDYGQVKHYIANNLKLLQEGPEADAMRCFFGITEQDKSSVTSIDADQRSCLLHCSIGSGSVKNSVLIGVRAEHIQAENSVIIDSIVPILEAKDSLLYNVVEEKPLSIKGGAVRADVFLPHRRQLKLYTSLKRDGSKDWTAKIHSNPLTFADLYTLNGRVNLQRANRWAVKMRSRALSRRVLDH